MKLTKTVKVLLIALLAVSCEKENPEIPHEHEVFSNVSLTLVPIGGSDEITFHWHDANGDLLVSNDEIENGSLVANTEYNAVISFNEQEEHDAHELHDDDGHEDHEDLDLDAEILNESTEHQLFFSSVKGLKISYSDVDSNGSPIGLETTFVTDDSFEGGELTITLRHEPIKNALGVASGNITNAGGETDVEITFSL
ncbi:MAG: hypothetical protein ACN4EF_06660 [Wenyingzhuangia sp.]|uniref:hypothetical protein n=1 Tax=Wenyingzhuangia sp. TaxID=1964193 RepID=UPI00321B77C1